MFLRLVADSFKVIYISDLFQALLSDQFIGKSFQLLLKNLPVAQKCIIGDIDVGLLNGSTFPNDNYDAMILNWGERVYGANGQLGRSFSVDVVYVDQQFQITDCLASFDCNGSTSRRPAATSYFMLFLPEGSIKKYGMDLDQKISFKDPQ